MEGSFNNKNIKPTLNVPTPMGKQGDTQFKREIRKSGMNLKENGMMINEKEESLKKKIFKLDKMETLVHTDETLSKIFNDMKQDAAEKFGYHWNETILNIIFNDFVLNSPKNLQKYKNTRAKLKKRRGEEGIKELQNDIEKDKEASSSAETRKQDLMAGTANGEGESKEKVDELFGFGKNVATELPMNKRSKNDTYFVDLKNKKMVAPVPYNSTPEEKQAIMQQYIGNPNLKQVSWYNAVKQGIKGVPTEVSDGSIEQMDQEMQKKYGSNLQTIPAMAEEIQVDDQMTPETYKLQVLYALKAIKPGLQLMQHVINLKPDTQGHNFLPLIQSNFEKKISPAETAQRIRDSWYGVSETTGAASAGAFSAPMGYQKKEVSETTTSASSGQYSGPRIWAKSPGSSRFAHKPAWKGGQIVSESIIKGNKEYLTEASVFRGYIMKNEIVDMINESFNIGEGEWEEHHKKMLAKVQKLAQEYPELANDPDIQDALKINAERAGQQQTGTVPTPVTVSEHHLNSKEEKIDFILQKTYDDATDSAKYSAEELAAKSDEEINSLYLSVEQSLGENNYKAALAQDVHNTSGGNVSASEPTVELEAKDGLFKGKWNTNESAGLSVDNLAKWAGQNVLYANTNPAELIQQYAQENGTSVQGLKDKAKFYASNAQLFPNGAAIKDVMLDLIGQIDELGLSEDIEMDNETPTEPEEDDCVVSSNGFKLSVSCGGKFVGEFTEDEQAWAAVRDWKKKNNWFPNTWFISDHGNATLVDDDGNSLQEGLFGGAPELNPDQIKVIIDKFNQTPESSDYRNQFVKAKDYVKAKAGNIARLPQLKMWLDRNMPQLSNYVSTLWGNWELMPKLNENNDMINTVEYKEFLKKKLTENVKSLKTLNEVQKKEMMNKFHKEFMNESMIDDQPDSMINNQESSIAASMASDELNVDGQPLASSSAPTEPQQEGYDSDDLKAKQSVLDKSADYSDEEPVADDSAEEPVAAAVAPEKKDASYFHSGSDDSQTIDDAAKFREMLKAKYGVESVSDLSPLQRQQLMKTMSFGVQQPEKSVDMDFSKFASNDADKAAYRERDQKRLDYLANNAAKVADVKSYFALANQFKAETGENMFHPMAILASIEQLPQDSLMRNKLSNIEKVLRSQMTQKIAESLNEERKTSSILNVEKLGAENAKNFKTDSAQEDALDQSKTYPKPQPADSIQKAAVYPNPKDFYIEQDVEKVNREAKTMADLEKEALAKSNGSLENIGNSTADGKHIPKRNLTKEEAYELAMNRGDGMSDIVYDNKPSDKFEERMKNDMGKEVYKIRQDKMEYRADAPMYNKDTQPTAAGDKKEENNKFKMGYNNESVTAKYKDENGKLKLVEFAMQDVKEVNTISEDATKLSIDGMGNKYSRKGTKINENVGFEEVADKYAFYMTENGIVAIEKSKMIVETKIQVKGNVNESSLDKMKKLMNYKPSNYVDTKKSVKF